MFREGKRGGEYCREGGSCDEERKREGKTGAATKGEKREGKAMAVAVEPEEEEEEVEGCYRGPGSMRQWRRKRRRDRDIKEDFVAAATIR